MEKNFKPDQYNSVSPYFVVSDAQRFIDLMKKIFNASELRRYDNPDGKIMHAEMKIEDSVIMLADSNENYPPHKLMTHVYVPDAASTFEIAVDHGCKPVEKPVKKSGDPDLRGSFVDFAGNFWSVGTQI